MSIIEIFHVPIYINEVCFLIINYIIFLQVCIAIRYFATGCNYSVIGDFVGVTQATISTCVREVAAFFYQRQQRYIIFPNTADQQNEIAADFAEKYGGIPSCIGAIDGTHIPILRPHHRERDFINRKRFLSLNVMVCITIYTV